MSAARFLGMVNDSRIATQAFYDLVTKWKNNKDDYKTALLEAIFEAYDPILGDVDLTQGTAAQLEKAFKEVPVAQGQMMTKTIRFLVKAVQFAGGSVSPHILKGAPRPRNGEGKPRRKVKPSPEF